MRSRRSISENLLHAVAYRIVLTGSTPEIVIRELVFSFGVALFDPWLPEAHDSVPVIGIKCLFRFCQQLLTKGFLHVSILPAGRPSPKVSTSLAWGYPDHHLTPVNR
jgi:hypothetical protein